LPLKWRKRLGKTIKKLNPQHCVDKNETVSRYKFALCFENNIYPGYVTEKIIDCLAAGVIPIYLGAPDIKKIIPDTAFIDMRDYSSWKDLLKKIQSVDQNEGEQMLHSAQDFVRSERGQRYTYDNHAKKIWDLLTG
jgi:hypothetical protein